MGWSFFCVWMGAEFSVLGLGVMVGLFDGLDDVGFGIVAGEV